MINRSATRRVSAFQSSFLYNSEFDAVPVLQTRYKYWSGHGLAFLD